MCDYAYRDNYLDLDPNYKDALGRPLIRMTYNFKDNNYKMGAFIAEKCAQIGRTMSAKIMTPARYRNGNSTPTDIVDAESTLTRARQRFTVATYDYLIALIRLDYAVGNPPAASLTKER